MTSHLLMHPRCWASTFLNLGSVSHGFCDWIGLDLQNCKAEASALLWRLDLDLAPGVTSVTAKGTHCTLNPLLFWVALPPCGTVGSHPCLNCKENPLQSEPTPAASDQCTA